MRQWVAGQETCLACGTTGMVLAAVEDMTRRHVRPRTCEACGARAARVQVYHDAALWPEAFALVQYGEACRRLGIVDQALGCRQQ